MRKITAVIMTCSMLLLTGCVGAEQQMTSTSLSQKGVETEAIYKFDAVEVPYQYRNSTNLYIAEAGENYIIRQRNLDGTNLVRLRPKKRGEEEYISIRFVDEKWIYYVRTMAWNGDDDFDEAELWRAPIKKTKKGDKVNIKKEEKILFDKDGILGNVYVKGNYVYYNQRADIGCDLISGVFKKYDMKKKRYVDLSKCGVKQSDIRETKWGMGNEDTMLLFEYGKAEGKIDDMSGVYIQKISQKKMRKIAPAVWNYVMYGNQFIYSKGETSLFKYNIKTGKTNVIFTQKDFRNVVKPLGIFDKDVVIQKMFRDGTKLYFLVEVEKTKKIEGYLLLSCDLKVDSSLKMEADWYKQYKEKDIDWFDLDEMWFVDGKVLWHGDCEYEVFDFNTGEVRKVTKKDEEYWWQYW